MLPKFEEIAPAQPTQTSPLLIFISKREYVRNYLQTNVLGGLGGIAPVYHAFDAEIEPVQSIRDSLAGTYHYGTRETELNTWIANVMMLRHSNRSPAFRFRFERRLEDLSIVWQRAVGRFRGGPEPQKEDTGFRSCVRDALGIRKTDPKGWRDIFHRALHLVSVYGLGRPGLAGIAKLMYEWSCEPNRQVDALLARIRPGLVILPSNAFGPILNDLLRLRKKHGYRLLVLVDNWDNLSSKSIFLYPLDYIGVWGEQGVKQAQRIHEIPREKIFKLGTPRFDHYFEALAGVEKGIAPQSPYPFDYVLFVGCAIAFDETTALIILDQACHEWNQQNGSNLKVVYRPHPLRQPRKREHRFEKQKFRNVVLDRQIREQREIEGTIRTRSQPPLDYYPPLLANARLVIGPLTTMLLEAAIFRRRILALVYDDGAHLTSPHNALKNFPHFEGFLDTPGVTAVATMGGLSGSFISALGQTESASVLTNHENALAEYLHRDRFTYRERLLAALREIES